MNFMKINQLFIRKIGDDSGLPPRVVRVCGTRIHSFSQSMCKNIRGIRLSVTINFIHQLTIDPFISLYTTPLYIKFEFISAN
jgi:hypothetical protein